MSSVSVTSQSPDSPPSVSAVRVHVSAVWTMLAVRSGSDGVPEPRTGSWDEDMSAVLPEIQYDVIVELTTGPPAPS